MCGCGIGGRKCGYHAERERFEQEEREYARGVAVLDPSDRDTPRLAFLLRIMIEQGRMRRAENCL